MTGEPMAIAEVVRSSPMFDREGKICACGETYTAWWSWQRECEACMEQRTNGERGAALADYKARAFKRRGGLAMRRLRELGLSRAECGADPALVPKAISQAIPETLAQDLSRQRPVKGFGLSGGQGIGKTFGLASVLKHAVLHAVEAEISSLKAVPVEGSHLSGWWRVCRFEWHSWPAASASLKAKVSFDDHRGVERFVQSCIATPVLFLDDLGRERMRGSYQEDYSAGQLDRIVDERSREGRPIIFTTNLDDAHLVGFYGSAFVSRLLGLAPMVELPDTLPDRRLDGDAGTLRLL